MADPRKGKPGGEGAGDSEESPEAKARSRALRILARREKSRLGLQRSLRRAGFDSSVVRTVLDELEAQGLVDDLRFCRLYLGEQARLRPRSLRLLQHDLRKEGIASEVVEAAFQEMSEQLEESALAAAAARKKLRVAGSDPERLRRLLSARGFSRRAVEEALRVVLAETGTGG